MKTALSKLLKDQRKLMIVSNQERVCRALTVLKLELTPKTLAVLQTVDGDQWSHKLADLLRKDTALAEFSGDKPHIDSAAILYIMWQRWPDFCNFYKLGYPEKRFISELRDARNMWAHQIDFDDDAAARTIDTTRLLIKAIGGGNLDELLALRNEIAMPAEVLQLPLVKRQQQPTTAYQPATTRNVRVKPAYIKAVEEHLDTEFTRLKGSTAISHDGAVAVCFTVSKNHSTDKGYPQFETYWYTIHARQLTAISVAAESHIALVCGSVEQILLIPTPRFVSWSNDLNPSTVGETGWHIHIKKEGLEWTIKRSGRGTPPIDVRPFLI